MKKNTIMGEVIKEQSDFQCKCDHDQEKVMDMEKIESDKYENVKVAGQVKLPVEEQVNNENDVSDNMVFENKKTKGVDQIKMPYGPDNIGKEDLEKVIEMKDISDVENDDAKSSDDVKVSFEVGNNSDEEDLICSPEVENEDNDDCPNDLTDSPNSSLSDSPTVSIADPNDLQNADEIEEETKPNLDRLDSFYSDSPDISVDSGNDSPLIKVPELKIDLIDKLKDPSEVVFYMDWKQNCRHNQRRRSADTTIGMRLPSSFQMRRKCQSSVTSPQANKVCTLCSRHQGKTTEKSLVIGNHNNSHNRRVRKVAIPILCARAAVMVGDIFFVFI